MSALAFEDLHEAAEKRAREAEEKLVTAERDLEACEVVFERHVAATRETEERTIAAVVALAERHREVWGRESETHSSSEVRSHAFSKRYALDMFLKAMSEEYWRPKGREGGE